MSPPSLQILESARLTAIISALQDVRNIPGNLKFLARTPVTPAVDGELLARFVGYVSIADIIADDQAATVYSTGKLQFESTNIPNIKAGETVSQSMLNLLQAVAAGTASAADMGIFSDYVNRVVDNRLLAVRQRMEQMIVSMQLDAFSYDRFGIKLTNATWGMPSDLKVTVAVPWDNPSADGIGDLLAQLLYAQIRYGKYYNRVTMSTTAFNYLTQQAAFRDRARAAFFPSVVGATLPTQRIQRMMPIVEELTGLQIELYDTRYFQQAADGATAGQPYLPVAKAILSDTADDNDRNVMDFGSGVVTESLVGNLTGSTAVVGGIPGPARGPIAYATTPPDLNPPNLTVWGVSRGFPRKKLLQATAVLTLGTFVTSVPTTPPFI